MARKLQPKEAHLSMRIEVSLLEALDAEADRMSSEQPGLKVARTDVVRMLLHEGLMARERARNGRGKAAG
jgi:hypothetical protein